jgi:hypothetical protein
MISSTSTKRSQIPNIREGIFAGLAEELKATGLKPREVRARLAEALSARSEGAQTNVQTPAPRRPWDVLEPSGRRSATEDQRLEQIIREIMQQTDWYRNETGDIQRNPGLYFRTIFRDIFPEFDDDTINQMAANFARESGASTTSFMSTQLTTARRLEEWGWLEGVLGASLESLRTRYFETQDVLRAQLLIKRETWSATEAFDYNESLKPICRDLTSVELMLVWFIGGPTDRDIEIRIGQVAEASREARDRLTGQQAIVLRHWLKLTALEARDENMGTIGIVGGDLFRAAEKSRLAPLIDTARSDYNSAHGALNEMKEELIQANFAWRIRDGLERAIAMPHFRPRKPKAGDHDNFYRNLLRSPTAEVDEYRRLYDLGFFKDCQSSETYRELLSESEYMEFLVQGRRRAAAVAPVLPPERR